MKQMASATCMLIFGLTATAPTAALQTHQEGPLPLPVGHPFPELWGSGKRTVLLEGDSDHLAGGVRYDTIKQEVILLWNYRFDLSGERRNYQQVEGVHFWPTEVTRVQGTEVLVAGVKFNGNTVMQLWELEVDADVPDPVYNSGTQQWTYPTSLNFPILRKSTVYNAQIAGQKRVRKLWPNRGRQWSFYVQFDDSGDVYDATLVDNGTKFEMGSLVKVLTPSTSPPTGVLSEPDIDNNFADRWDDDHIQHGYVYFAGDRADTAPAHPRGVVMFDADRNGTIDSSMSIGMAEWNSMGFGDAAQYNDYF